MIQHDRLFKQLLAEFFAEFVELFVPTLADYMDSTSVILPDKQIFSGGKTHEVDLVAQTRFKGKEAVFLVHVELQAQHQRDFPRRLFNYFARLHDKHCVPVYPIALFSFQRPKKPQQSSYTVDFDDLAVLRFNYAVIQLNRLSWRQFLKHPNPVAAALMARMHIAPRDRVRVKSECLRSLYALNLDSKQQDIISEFVDTYLSLTDEEEENFHRELAKLPQPEQEAIMQTRMSWQDRGRLEGRLEGRQQGRLEGLLETTTRQLSKRFGAVEQPLLNHLGTLLPEQLEALSEALLDFSTASDLEQWLKTQDNRSA